MTVLVLMVWFVEVAQPAVEEVVVVASCIVAVASCIVAVVVVAPCTAAVGRTAEIVVGMDMM